MDNDKKDLTAGFNAGYILEKYQPELAKQLVEGIETTDALFIEGFIAGSKESILEREKTRSKVVSKLKGFAKDRIPRPTKSRDKGSKGKDFGIDR